MRHRTTALVTAVAVLGAGAAVTTLPALAATKTVKGTSKDTWSPRTLTVKRGDTVRFTWNNTGAPHNVRKTSGPGTLKGGRAVTMKGSGTYRATKKGTARFVCDVHADTMRFTLRVK